MASYPNTGDRVTVRAREGEPGVVRCVVVRRRAKRVFMARYELGTSSGHRWCTPKEEGTGWARGWQTQAALALEALVMLDNSR